ncbi:MAG TPA: efflux transporter outer membrane subunit [Deltaproteobacteria bacterium]|nr:efflux transporter outer membrane subunit [Deltaproteobacteria bacterium]HPR54030.1 efflux transporter outer membrane subunit [Deltaproteobacteria bacterium]HXK46810.1 efflux transporter outer membrane subunit [Deltaproteobacteria bacterium]
MRKILILSVVAAVLSGCALGPDYVRPAVETPQAWRYEAKDARDVADTLWWEQFGDPALNGLIETALQENKDLRVAAARVNEYEGRLMVARADLFPKADASYQAGKNRLSEHGSSRISSLITNPYHQYQLGLGAAWELDIWGRYRRADEAARADLLATEESRRGVILSLCSNVAVGYVNLLDLDNQLLIARRTAENTKKTLDLFQIRFKGGVISDLELSQVRSQYALTLTRIPAIEKLIAQQEDALSVLLGRNPGAIARGRAIDELSPPAIPQGLPSELLERRPDVRQAEQNLVAANARIGEARSLYFPNISLTGAFGWSSTHLSDLITSPARVWSWGGAIDAPIFAGGAIKGQNRVAEAVQQEAMYTYLKTVQNAFREVNDFLMNQKYDRDQLDAQKMQVEALRDYAHIARTRFDNGYTSYIEVLDAESSLFEAELSYSQTQGTFFSDLVGLYKAMGGGWVTGADGLTAPQDRQDAQEKSE